MRPMFARPLHLQFSSLAGPVPAQFNSMIAAYLMPNKKSFAHFTNIASLLSYAGGRDDVKQLPDAIAREVDERIERRRWSVGSILVHTILHHILDAFLESDEFLQRPNLRVLATRAFATMHHVLALAGHTEAVNRLESFFSTFTALMYSLQYDPDH